MPRPEVFVRVDAEGKLTYVAVEGKAKVRILQVGTDGEDWTNIIEPGRGQQRAAIHDPLDFMYRRK